MLGKLQGKSLIQGNALVELDWNRGLGSPFNRAFNYNYRYRTIFHISIQHVRFAVFRTCVVM